MINNVIINLKKTKKMHNKYLAKRLSELAEKPNKEVEYLLKKECYRLLFLLVTDDVKKELKKIDAIVKIITKRMESDVWKWDGNSFRHAYSSSKIITRSPIGFQGGVSPEEQDFIELNQEGLVVLNDLLNEKESIINNSIPLKDERDRSLAESIIEYVFSPQENYQVKLKK